MFEVVSLGNLAVFDGLSAGASSDIQVLFDGLPDPIDRDLDRTTRTMYWTDRGDPPRGNTVNRARMDSAPGRRKDSEIVFTHLMEGIGLALDIKNQRMFMSDSQDLSTRRGSMDPIEECCSSRTGTLPASRTPSCR